MATSATTYTVESALAQSSYTGANLGQRVADLVPPYDDTVSAEQNRMFRHATLVQEDIANEIRSVQEDFFLVSATFPTVADRSPNRYALPANGAGGEPHMADMRYLERVIDDTTGDYERIPPIHHLEDKNFSEFDRDLRFLLDSTGSGTGKPAGYFLGGDFIQIEPISDAVYTLRMYYEPVLTTVASGANLDIPDQLFPALVFGTAVREYLYRRLSDWQDLETKYQESLVRGLAAIQQRSDDSARFTRYLDDASMYV